MFCCVISLRDIKTSLAHCYYGVIVILVQIAEGHETLLVVLIILIFCNVEQEMIQYTALTTCYCFRRKPKFFIPS